MLVPHSSSSLVSVQMKSKQNSETIRPKFIFHEKCICTKYSIFHTYDLPSNKGGFYVIFTLKIIYSFCHTSIITVKFDGFYKISILRKKIKSKKLVRRISYLILRAMFEYQLYVYQTTFFV